MSSDNRYDVFISYSRANFDIADKIRHVLEQNNLKCWIAPRDIPSGKNYLRGVAEGIRMTKIVVLVYSKHSQNSDYVNNEVEMAFSNNKPILSFNIDQSEPSEDMKYYLKVTQWLNAYPNPEDEFETLIRDALKLCDESIDSPIMLDFTNFRHEDLSKHKRDYWSLLLLATPLYWSSFLYMGTVSNKKSWILVGLLFSIPSWILLAFYFQILGMLFMNYPMFILFALIFVIFWILAIIYALAIRNEFLTRKSILRFSFSDDELFEYLYEEYVQI